jgi:hypothetical protein
MVCSYLFPEERTLENYKKLPEILEKSGEISKKRNSVCLSQS